MTRSLTFALGKIALTAPNKFGHPKLYFKGRKDIRLILANDAVTKSHLNKAIRSR